MTNSSEEFVMRGDTAVEELLGKAEPRPAPPSEDERIIREAVMAEWQAVTGRIRVRRRVTYFAVAATVLLAVAFTFNALQVSNAPVVQVATITKSHGSVYLLGDQAELHEMVDLMSISAGQIIETGVDAGIGVAWSNGGSLRVDARTRVEFTSADAVYLKSGRIYFDSEPSVISAGISAGSDSVVAGITGSSFMVETDHGSVRHLGTQYMTAADTDRLTVSVREGQVAVDGVYVEEAMASAGQQLTLSGGARPTILDIDGFGGDWAWIEAMAPQADVDGRTVDEFLRWVGRQTGLKVVYESDAAEVMAHQGILRGNLQDIDPRGELALRMSGEDLGYRIEAGTIYVSLESADGRP